MINRIYSIVSFKIEIIALNLATDFQTVDRAPTG
jgi:hypothetical protein